MKNASYSKSLGELIRQVRIAKGMTQEELATALGTSQSAVNRIERGGQNISVETIEHISQALSNELIRVNTSGKTNFRIEGGHELHGEIRVNTSKNAAVALLCASLLNKGTTTLKQVARIEEVYRIIEVLESIGVAFRWLENSTLEIKPPKKLHLDKMDKQAAKRTRSVIMLLGPLMHQYSEFKIPFAGGCSLGTRTVEPHLIGLRAFGMGVEAPPRTDYYKVSVKPKRVNDTIVLIERGDTVTENLLMAAALYDGEVTIHNASPNYMVQDVCFFLQQLGVQITGVGTTSLTIRGVKSIEKDVEYSLGEDPIEAMSFIAAAVVTQSEITITRAPIEFLEIELAVLKEMGLRFIKSKEYLAENGKMRLVDLSIKKSKLRAPKDKIHALPYPGINMDNLPFMGLCATVAEGRTLIHDWSYDNRAIYFTELAKLNANIELIDPHRVFITGPTKWKSADITAPTALRPSVVLLLAMMAAPGKSMLRDTYNINRGYEDIANRLNSLGAKIETVWE